MNPVYFALMIVAGLLFWGLLFDCAFTWNFTKGKIIAILVSMGLCLLGGILGFQSYNSKHGTKVITVRTAEKPQIDTVVTNRTDTLFIYNFSNPIR